MPIHILEAEIVLGVLYRKGGKPKRVGTLGSREKNRDVPFAPNSCWNQSLQTDSCKNSRTRNLPCGPNYYTCHSKPIKNVSVSVTFFVTSSETIQECKCYGELQECNGEL